ncbi:HSF-type DNA-binding-domain-containing protein [Pilaira anomala]|nr:HSF-type DNA-binding-domain-containing protein [Pilaira anomala]
MDSNSTTENNQSTLKKRPLPSFIKKLWFILNDVSSQEYIYWVDNGQVICVPNASAFSKVILPRFFKHSNWQSFVRQLNLYGFRKVYQLNLAYDEPDEKKTAWQFKHECFRKDDTEKLCEIKRRTAKSQENTADYPSSSPPPPPPPANQQQGTDMNFGPESIEQTLSIFSQRLEHVDRKRRDLVEQTIELNRIQLKQQKVQLKL